jgi:hypothetical protein
MFLSINHANFIKHNIMISDKVKNNVMIGSDFHRIIFSDEFCSTNGTFINFTLKNVTIEKYFNKMKCMFELSPNNSNIINNIKNIEKEILQKFQNRHKKIMTYRIQEQLSNGFIKLYGNDHISYGKKKETHFLLKVSGIWVSNKTNEIGLTFRFFIFNNHI